MTGELLWRGMLAGLVEALLAGLFALAVAEPQVDGAIAFEEAHAAAAHHDMGGEEELVSRATQKGAELFTALGLYGAAVGGISALSFAYAYGRIGRIGPRSLALLLAIAAFVLVPAIKYPPTPSAVGQHKTVRLRTAALFGMILLSLDSALVASRFRRTMLLRFDALTTLLATMGGYELLVAIVQVLLPTIDEVPGDFPASLPWQFRVASLGSQLILWLALGILFDSLAERRLWA